MSLSKAVTACFTEDASTGFDGPTERNGSRSIREKDRCKSLPSRAPTSRLVTRQAKDNHGLRCETGKRYATVLHVVMLRGGSRFGLWKPPILPRFFRGPPCSTFTRCLSPEPA